MAQPQKHTKQDIANATVGYNNAVLLMTYEGGLVWSRYNAMLLANSVILALTAASFSASETRFPVALLIVLSVAGWGLCLVWYLVTKRGFDYYRYWILSGRELEEKFLSPAVLTLSRGATFSKGKSVDLRFGGKVNKEKMSWEVGEITHQQLAYIPITIMASIYIVTFVLALKR